MKINDLNRLLLIRKLYDDAATAIDIFVGDPTVTHLCNMEKTAEDLYCAMDLGFMCDDLIQLTKEELNEITTHTEK